MKNLEILHICVNYGNNQETKAFVENCRQLRGADKVQFVVCDNSFGIDSAKDFIFARWQQPDEILVLPFADNPGYLGAAYEALLKVAKLRGLTELSEQAVGQKYRYIILSNSDLQISTQDFYLQLLSRKVPSSGEMEKVGILAPSIRSLLTNKEGNPLYQARPSTKKINFLVKVYSWYPFAVLYHLLSFIKVCLQGFGHQSNSAEIYAAHGAFLIFTDEFFASGGTFNYPAKLYGEELFLAEQLRRFGLKTVLVNDLKVLHREKGTEQSLWHRIGLSRRTFEYKRESSRVIARAWS